VKDANTAVSFDGTDDQVVTTGDVYGFTGTSVFSVEAWVKPTDGSSFMLIAGNEGFNVDYTQWMGWMLAPST
jgi:hypothetical protein